MDILLGKVTQQAMNYAIRSGITITASYALRQSSRLLKTIDGNEKDELQTLQERLNNKIKILSPAIDMIELISARSNTTLESAVALTKSLRWDIQSLGRRLAAAANMERQGQEDVSRAKTKAAVQLELRQIIAQIKSLLSRIEDAVPLINLAITTSGVNLSTNLPLTISPSRLLQASTLLTAGDTQYSMSMSKSVQIGPTFTLSLYMLFMGHIRPQNEEEVRETTWKEVVHKARVKLVRVSLDSIYELPDPSSSLAFGSSISESQPDANDPASLRIAGEAKNDEYAYQIVIVEDLDDGRVHSFEDNDAQPSSYDDILEAGIREPIPVHEISRIFYADTGKILNIGSEDEVNNPVLLLKRDMNAIPPRRVMTSCDKDVGIDEDTEGFGNVRVDTGSQTGEQDHRDSPTSTGCGQRDNGNTGGMWKIPQNLDPEWLAFEVYTEQEDSDMDSDTGESSQPRSKSESIDPQMTSAMSNLNLSKTSSPAPSPPLGVKSLTLQPKVAQPAAIRTSLSLLETLLRLSSLQQFQQASHLSITDELLNFFLSESATTGAAQGDDATRRRLRHEARMRVGFDPYDESPIKRHGEEYQYRGGKSQVGGPEWNDNFIPSTPDGEQWRQDDLDVRGYSTPPVHDEGYGTKEYTPKHVPRFGSPRTPLYPISYRGSSSSPSAVRSMRSGDARRLDSLSPGTPARMQGKSTVATSQARMRMNSPLAGDDSPKVTESSG